MSIVRAISPIILATAVTGCSEAGQGLALPQEGPWHLALHLDGVDLPFLFDLEHTDEDGWKMVVHNADEAIVVHEVELRNDSLFVRMPLFDSEFHGAIKSRKHIAGHWINHLKGPDHKIQFDAHAGLLPRFSYSKPAVNDLSGHWETQFETGTDRAFSALGQFHQEESGRLTGTFMTETGDYRYLEGLVHGDSMHLSSFDGTFALLFAARFADDTLRGRFWSGSHWQCEWKAHRNPEYTLRDPDSLTRLREGYDMVDFRFPDLDGHMVTPRDEQFKNKVILVQIMGSWCPNCVDETRLLNDLYNTYNPRGLEIISIAFEKHEDPDRSLAGLRRFRNFLGVRYPILYAGTAGKGQTAEKLPFLDHFMSFPTCIMIDRRGIVRRIRTGNYGPGTGDYYTNYKRGLEQFISTLLDEPIGPKLAER